MPEWDDETHVGEVTPDRPEAGARDRAYLIVLTGTNVGEMFKLGERDLVLGRGEGADVTVIDDGVSRRHAAIRLAGGETWIEDTGSKNGTFVNGDKIERRRLHDGDKIQIGSTTILKFSYHDHFDESFQRRMFESALRDGLTRAFNKKYLLDRLESEFRFAKRHDAPLALVLLDLDHFKALNDAHGHIAGDRVLAAFARKIHDSIRNEDVFARYGGEEFVILCRAIEVERAVGFAERLRRTIEALEIPHEDKVLRVTVSIGVAGLPDPEIVEPLGLIAAADEALYAAKRDGRNRVAR
jgi:diguanylate cyclase (GGDEF)-like protein